MTSSYACPPIQTVRENLRDGKEGDGGIQVMQLAFVLAKNEPAYVEAANGVVPVKNRFFTCDKKNLERYIIYYYRQLKRCVILSFKLLCSLYAATIYKYG